MRICLDSVFRQTVLPKEVVIGDDGSTQETALLIEDMRRRSPVPLIHVWHEDWGFRLAMMRNKSVAHPLPKRRFCNSKAVLPLCGVPLLPS